MLHVLRCLAEQDDFWVELAQFVDLNVGHGDIVVHHLLAKLLLVLLFGQHVIVHSLIEHAFKY